MQTLLVGVVVVAALTLRLPGTSWTPLLLLPVVQVFGGGLRRILAHRQKAFLFYWVALPFAFFSLSQNKLPGYLLPILPPLTLWIASLLEEGFTSEPRASASGAFDHSPPQKLSLWLLGLSALLLLTLPIVLGLLPESLATGLRQALTAFQPDYPFSGGQPGSLYPPTQIFRGPVPWAVWLALAGLVILSLYLLVQKRMLEACLAVLLGVCLTTLAITQFISPSINRIASMRRYAQRIESLGIPAEQLGVQRLYRNHLFGLSFYLDRSLPEWSPESGPASVSFVITREEERLEGARSLILFPGPGLRVWALGPAESHPR